MIGVSFKRYLTGEVQEPPRGNYGVELHHQAAWVDGEWKLRRLVPRGLTAGDAPWQLFNLHDDRWRRMMSRPNIPIGQSHERGLRGIC